ncbi:MAG: hypothetical protein WDN02_10490 [Methylovirgula sp.]|uniref:hypothetical protein n=1 Tax=Methylovirgula sp. TaxID=1978224 RepID=UPI0030760704
MLEMIPWSDIESAIVRFSFASAWIALFWFGARWIKQWKTANSKKHIEKRRLAAVNLELQPYKHAAALPLNDAAFLLWKEKSQLDRAENPTPAPTKSTIPTNPGDPEIFARAVRKAITQVIFDRDNGHFGPTFYRLKAVYPESDDIALRNAIKAAIKLNTACNTHFSYSDRGLDEDVKHAVDAARQENPCFEEETYKRASSALRFAMMW